MAAAGVPTGMAHICDTEAEAAAALDAFGPPYVVKEDGLAAGKGVVVTNDREAALAHAAACGRVLIEEFLDGPEVSLFASPTAPRCCRCSLPRTSSASATATRVRTPAAWAPIRRCRGRPRAWLTSSPAGAPTDGRRDAPPRYSVPRAAVRRTGADLTRRSGRGVQRQIRRPGDPAADGPCSRRHWCACSTPPPPGVCSTPARSSGTTRPR